MRITAVIAALIVTPSILLAQRGSASGGIALRQFEVCRVHSTPEAALVKFVGRAAVYRITIDREGKTVAMEGVETSPLILRLFHIEVLEPCVRRWRFAESGIYTMTLFGGPAGIFRLDIAKGTETLEVTIPDLVPR